MKRFLRLFVFLALSGLVVVQFAHSQSSPAADPRQAPADLKAVKAPKPMAFWAATPPEVVGKLEAKYDINVDGILQTSEVKVFLRRVSAQIKKDNINFNIEDSKLLKAYDKNKDGIISKLELDEIKKDLSY